MALVRCPECGRGVSSLAGNCPYCGCPRTYFSTPKPSLNVGDKFTFGTYGGQAVVWRVIEVTDRRALLLSEYAIESKPYKRLSLDTTWAQSDVRLWLNRDFLYGAFTPNERGRIEITYVENDYNPDYATHGGNDTHDYLFLLSIDEARTYFDYNEDRICYPTNFAINSGVWTNVNGACSWWLRSPGLGSKGAARVSYDGYVSTGGSNVGLAYYGVRPAMWVNL